MKVFFQKVWRELIIILLLQCTIEVVHYYIEDLDKIK